MHDAICTEEKPLPLDASREKELNPKKEEKKEETKPPEKKVQKDLPIQKPPSGEFPDVFECDICHQMFTVKERDDHMLCHKLEKEEKNKEENFEVNPEVIARQKAIEKQIEREKRQREQRDQYNDNMRNNNMNDFFIPNIGVNNFDRGDPNINLGMGNFLNNLGNAISQQQMSSMHNFSNNMNNNNNSQNGGNSNSSMTVRFVTIGPNGQSIVQTFQSNGNNGNNGQNQPNPSINIFSNNQRRRRFIPFMNFNNEGALENIFEQFLQSMGNREHPTDEEILNELPETQIEDATKLDPEKKNCIICLEDFKNGDKAIILPCIHIFHTECIKNWLKTQDTCPICKFKLTGENINSANGGTNM
jgi:hypothetical protein